MSTENNEFFELLKTLANEQAFDLELLNGTTIKCKQLSTAQLKELIKTIVDSPITQIEFNSTATRIFKQSATFPDGYVPNVIDRLLFLLETRIQTISSKMTIVNNDSSFVVDFENVKQKIKEQIALNKSLFEQGESSESSFGLTFGPPTLLAEEQLNSEIYSDMIVNTDDPQELRKLVGNIFVYEIAKSLKTVKIQDKIMDLSTGTFENRVKVIESIPASAIQKAIEYIEKQKRVIDECLTVNDYTIPIDGSLFSLR